VEFQQQRARNGGKKCTTTPDLFQEEQIIITIEDEIPDSNTINTEDNTLGGIIRGGFVSEVITTKNKNDNNKCSTNTEKIALTNPPEQICKVPKNRTTQTDPMSSILPNCKAWTMHTTKSLTTHTLVLETFPPHIDYYHFKEASKVDPKAQQQQTISHYFGSQSLPKTDVALLKKKEKAGQSKSK